MKYVKRTEYKKIKDKYEHIIAWGTGPIFQMNYQKSYFDLDFIIDGTGSQVGRRYNNIEIKGEDCLIKIKGKTLIVIYTIYENQVLQQISRYDNGNIDIILCSLLDIKLKNHNMLSQINAKSGEDFLTLMLCRQLALDTIQFLEIGVCHPVLRNNTYLLNEQLSCDKKRYKGVLVEPNPLCWNLIEEYRANDLLLKCGVGESNEEKEFFAFPDLLGHSTFVKDLAKKEMERGTSCEVISVKMKTINNIIEDNFEQVPDLLALDAEGMDFFILNSWNSIKYPFKIVITESMEISEDLIQKLMRDKGYRMYAKTLENIIWVKDDYHLFV